MSKLTMVLMLLISCGCGAHYRSRDPLKRAYQFTYCNKMNPDGKHCDFWATPCGKLHCRL